MSGVSLRQIDEGNFLDCFALKLAEGQERFVSSPVRSLAQAYVYRRCCTPFGVYAGETMVGYVMVIYDSDENTYNLWHLMIDRRFQGRGYGRAMLDFVCAQYRGRCPAVFAGTGDSPLTVPFYEKCGFVLSHRIPNFFTDNYDHPIIEAGVRLTDMVYLKKEL